MRHIATICDILLQYVIILRCNISHIVAICDIAVDMLHSVTICHIAEICYILLQYVILQ